MTTLAELRKLAQAATPGPWEWDGDVCAYDHEQEAPWLVTKYGAKKVLTGTIECNNSWTAGLIAACSPERIIALIACVEAADAMLSTVPIVENIHRAVYIRARAALEDSDAP